MDDPRCHRDGAGMAGMSTAFEPSANATVLLLEADALPGYRSTGRSAALFIRNRGSPLGRRIDAPREAFFRPPPLGFVDVPLLHPAARSSSSRLARNIAATPSWSSA